MFEIVLAATDSALQFFQQRIEKLIGFLRSLLFCETVQRFKFFLTILTRAIGPVLGLGGQRL